MPLGKNPFRAGWGCLLSGQDGGHTCLPSGGVSQRILFGLLNGRGVWQSHPTTRNEALHESGKQGLIIPMYLPGCGVFKL